MQIPLAAKTPVKVREDLVTISRLLPDGLAMLTTVNIVALDGSEVDQSMLTKLLQGKVKVRSALSAMPRL